MRPRGCYRQPSLPSLVPTKIHEAQGLSLLNVFGFLKKQFSFQTSKSLRTHSAFLLGEGSWEANLGQRHSKESLWVEGIGLCSEGIEFLLSLPPTKNHSNFPFRQAKAFVHIQPFSPSLPSLVPTKIHEAQGVLQAAFSPKPSPN